MTDKRTLPQVNVVSLRFDRGEGKNENSGKNDSNLKTILFSGFTNRNKLSYDSFVVFLPRMKYGVNYCEF